jgi:hypothetical protein
LISKIEAEKRPRDSGHSDKVTDLNIGPQLNNERLRKNTGQKMVEAALEKMVESLDNIEKLLKPKEEPTSNWLSKSTYFLFTVYRKFLPKYFFKKFFKMMWQ